MAKRTNLKEVPTREERLNGLIIQYADLQQQESHLEKAKKYVRAEIENLFPPFPEGGEEVKIEINGIVAKRYYPKTTVVYPEKLWALANSKTEEAPRLLDAFWRLVEIPIKVAEDNLSGEVFHAITCPKTASVPKLLIRKGKEAE